MINNRIVLSNPKVLVSENEWDERSFVLLHKDIYVNKHAQHGAGSHVTMPDVVKLDFERLADYIRFEALKKKHIITIDRIKEILDA